MMASTQDKKKCGKRYSNEEKEEILNYYDENGFNDTLTTYGMSPDTLNNWIKKKTTTPTTTTTPKKSILEEIIERRTGLNEQKQTTTPKVSTTTATTTTTTTTTPKINAIIPQTIATTTTPTTTTNVKKTTTTTLIPTTKSLTFEQIVEKLIEYGKNSSFNDYNNVYQSLIAGNKKGDRNPRFQSKRIKDALRMLEAMGIKFVQEGN